MLLLKGHRARVHKLAFSADGRTLASASGNAQAVWLWDICQRRARAVLRGHPNRVTGLAFAPDGRTLATTCSWGWGRGSPQELVKLWDVDTGQPLGSLPVNGYSTSFTDPVFAPSGRRLLTGGRSQVHCWDVQTWEDEPFIFQSVPRPETAAPPWWTLAWPVTTLAVSPDGSTLAAGNTLGWVAAWRLFEDRAASNLGQFNGLRRLRFSPDGRTLALTRDAGVTLWDVAAAGVRTSLYGHRRVVNGLAFSPDGRLLATASNDGTVRLWEVDSGRERTVFDWNVGEVGSVAFSPDGLMLAAGGDANIVVWDVDET